MEFKTIGGHTFAPELLSDGVIIDIGCRDFSFANYFKAQKVYCIDVDPKVFIIEDGKVYNQNHVHMNVAISDKAGDSAYYENGEGTCLKEIDPDQNHTFKPCKTITMEDLYKIIGENVDILKLDCEGAEYIILGETFKPIPKQISVEWHFHCVPNLHNEKYEAIHNKLLERYDVFNNEWEEKHGCGKNLWDVLYIRKDLINTGAWRF